MSIARALLAVGAVVMAAALVYGFAMGDGWEEVAELWAYPWFRVSLVDVYVGFALFLGWVVYRERSPLVALIWIALVLGLGNLVTCAYALIAAVRCGGDWRRFWMGARAGV